MRVLVTGLAPTGVVASRRRSRRDPTSRSSSASTRATRASRWNARSSCAPTRRTRSSPASCAPRRSTRSCTRHLLVDSTRASGRTLHEINVIGTMNLLAAAGAPGSPVRKVVLKSSGLVYGANYKDPYRLPRRHDAYRPRPHGRRAFVARGRGDSCATSPTTTRTSTSRCCASPTCSATTSTRRSRSRSGGRSFPRSSASILGCSSCTRTTSSTR